MVPHEKAHSFLLVQVHVCWCLTRVSTVVCLTMFSSLCWWFLVGWGPVLFFSSFFCNTHTDTHSNSRHVRWSTHTALTHCAACWASHRHGVPLQHQLLGSPHLLLLHLSADCLLGLIGQLTARGQAWIPNHILNAPEQKRERHTHTQSIKICQNTTLSPLSQPQANTEVNDKHNKWKLLVFGAIVHVFWHKTMNLFFL